MSYKSKIYLVGKEKGKLMPLEETGFVQESDLQELLADYPDLIPGDQINSDAPRRWLLVSREVGVPDENDGTDRWSLDHLFLDQDGIPTFVECKRSSDTRNRREVVAQMLDYVANGVEYWDVASLRQTAAEEATSRGKLLDQQILELLGENADSDSVEEYWNIVEDNLKEHNVRLIFVADSIPKELRRLVEFLNEEMAKIEVLAVELKSYQGINNEQALVPRVVGLTETIRAAKQKGKTTYPTEIELVQSWSLEAQEAYYIFNEKALAYGVISRMKKTQVSYRMGKHFFCGFHGYGEDFKIWLRTDSLNALFDFENVAKEIKQETSEKIRVEHTPTWFVLTYPASKESAKDAFDLLKRKVLSQLS